MAQFARPNSDATLNAWQDGGGGSTDIFQAIDEATASDTDFDESPNNPGTASDFYEAGLSTVTDPTIGTGHIVRYRYRKNNSGGRQIDMQVHLYQGTTLIASGSNHANISNAWTAGSFTLTGGEADSITDYAALEIRFSPNTVGGGPGRRGQISWAELEVPDAASIVNVGFASETASAFATSRLKTAHIGQPAQADSALSAAPNRDIPASFASETDAAPAIDHRKSVPTGVASDTNSAFAAAPRKTVQVGLAAGSDVALTSAAVRAIAVGVASGSSIAQPTGHSKAVRLGNAPETNVATATAAQRLIGIGLAADLNSAFVTAHSKSVVVGHGNELNLALPAMPERTVPVGVAAQSDTALFLSETTQLGIAAESDFSLGMQAGRVVTLGVASEATSSLSVAPARLLALNLASENDQALVIGGTKIATCGIARESDTALVVTSAGGYVGIANSGLSASFSGPLTLAAIRTLDLEFGANRIFGHDIATSRPLTANLNASRDGDTPLESEVDSA